MKWYNIVFLVIMFPLGIYVMMSKLPLMKKIQILFSSFLTLWKGKATAKKMEESTQSS